jgi:hypothetical protein
VRERERERESTFGDGKSSFPWKTTCASRSLGEELPLAPAEEDNDLGLKNLLKMAITRNIDINIAFIELSKCLQ